LSTPSAILDVHFGPINVPSHYLGVATSTGSFSIYELKKKRDVHPDGEPLEHPSIEHIKTIQYCSEDVLITAFSWHPKGWSIGMTLSSGQVCLGHIDSYNDGVSTSTVDVTNHELEAWTLAFSPDGSGMYSGGDDSALQYVEVATNKDYHQDFAAEAEYGPERRMPWTDKKIHGAGVTAILPLRCDTDGSLVLTGSYDDHVRLVQIPVIGRRMILSELNLGGGVWRLKRLYSLSNEETPLKEDVLLLASCMHVGARILKLIQDEERTWHFEVVAKFEEHKSMNYGSDCQSTPNAKGQRTFITTSFYDRLLCLWRY
jgi:diphthamide biosynthesis protein 7